MSEALSQADKQTSEQAEQPSPAAPRSRRLMRVLGLLLIIMASLLAYFLIIAYFGWQSGQTASLANQEAELAEQLARQVSLARDDIGQGNYNRALLRLEWVLERAPDYPDAEALQEQAQAALDVPSTPQSQSAVTGVATTTPLPPLPTVTAGPIESPNNELQRIRRLVATKAWGKVVPALITFQMQFPSYEREETDALLYDAYINLGLELVNGDEVESGLFYLAQAEKLGDLSQSVIDYRAWAQLYLQGVAFYGVNWGATVYYFRDLCMAAPFYQSSCERLHEVLILNGDQYAAVRDWCPAQLLYEEARGYGTSASLAEKAEQARAGCLTATPTPMVTITGTAPITSTQPLTGTSFIIPTPSVTPTGG